MQNLLGLLLFVLPKNLMSYWVGRLVHVRLPKPLSLWSIKLFAKKYSINLDEAEHPVEQYQSIGELFTRKLKEGVRPVAGDCNAVHPCDSKLTARGEVENGSVLQAKGKRYSVADFLVNKELAEKVQGGRYLTYYLCPTDYHRVHSPVEGRVRRVVYVPGQLWPVNDWSVNKIDQLFAVNERMVVEVEAVDQQGEPLGTVAIVFVGATNVGKITLSFGLDWVSNQPLEAELRQQSFGEDGPYLYRGSELGIFHMGSTIVMIGDKAISRRMPDELFGGDAQGLPVQMGRKFF